MRAAACAGACAACQRRRDAASPRRRPPRPPASSPSFLQFSDEYSFNLAEYMVHLDKPVGLTLAPEPHTGRVSASFALCAGAAAACALRR